MLWRLCGGALGYTERGLGICSGVGGVLLLGEGGGKGVVW